LSEDSEKSVGTRRVFMYKRLTLSRHPKAKNRFH
jgi:hypothetical protein